MKTLPKVKIRYEEITDCIVLDSARFSLNKFKILFPDVKRVCKLIKI